MANNIKIPAVHIVKDGKHIAVPVALPSGDIPGGTSTALDVLTQDVNALKAAAAAAQYDYEVGVERQVMKADGTPLLWYDGKPIYEQCFDVSSPAFTLPANTSTTQGTATIPIANIPSMSAVVSYEAADFPNNAVYPFTSFNGASRLLTFNTTNGDVEIRFVNYLTTSIEISIIPSIKIKVRYTK